MPVGDRQRKAPDPAAALELHDKSSNHMFKVGPRHARPNSDDLVLSISHRTYGQPTSILASRARARELHDWLGRWLADGWPGVARCEGPTSADVIEHYRDIAGRERLRADDAAADAGRRVDAALALIPEERRSEDLDAIAKAQAQAWWRLQRERDHYKNTRDLLVQCLHDIKHYTGESADAFRKAAGRALDLATHPKSAPDGGQPPPAPIHDLVQLDLLALVQPETVEASDVR